ncbi:interleukin-1 receptor-associated kinase 3 [Rhinophrynus dorsalis]
MMAAPGLSLNPDMSLFEVPPSLMENFCKIMDCSDGDLGWRGLAERLSPDWMEFRKIERYAEQGKSRTRELLWSWAHKNKTICDLLLVLQDMGHERAIHLFKIQGASINWQNHSSTGLKDIIAENCGESTLEYIWMHTPDSQHKVKNTLPSINFEMVKQGTKDFHQDLLIGHGQYFDVYKAEIHKQKCVVKILKQEKQLPDPRQWKLFVLELRGLPRFQHPNILELLGYFSADERTYLVYPYLMNGSLFNRIQCTGNTSPLSWQVRYNILVGVARAIQYLHAVKPCPVICGNITSKNILLDQHFQPKLSDFAMVHLRSYLINHLGTIKMDHATLKSLGYLPEEYIRRGNLSSKTDVYSYGILMMELLTGHQAVLKGSTTLYLKELLWEQMEKSGVESLYSFLDKKSDGWPQCVAHKLLSLCIDCTVSREKHRPTMEEVLERIESAGQRNEDQPMSLKSVLPSHCPGFVWYPNVPVESDESQDDPVSLLQRRRTPETPCECSKSEATFLGETRKNGDSRTAGKIIPSMIQRDNPSYVDLMLQVPEQMYLSRPVECSCSSGPDSTKPCEECMANGF